MDYRCCSSSNGLRVAAQVAAGGQYQTWITVTNKGTQLWEGNFYFYNGSKAPWNPYVDGIQVSGGNLDVTIPSKATRTFKVSLPGGTEAGYLIARAGNTNLDNFLEGNLTYYISSDGTILDSVGSSSNVYGLFGQIDSDNTLELHYEAVPPGLGIEVIGFFKSDGPYTPGQSTITGTFKTYIPSLSSYKTGTFTATLIP
jgi:hypothetical protein